MSQQEILCSFCHQVIASDSDRDHSLVGLDELDNAIIRCEKCRINPNRESE